MTPPWSLLGRCGRDPETIARECGTALTLPAAAAAAAAIAWWRARAAGGSGVGEGPPGVPVLARGESEQGIGWIGWVRATAADDVGDDEPWATAAACARRWACELGAEPRGLGFDRRHLAQEIWGKSSGLSALLAAGLHFLGAEYPTQATLACTGELRDDGGHPRLTPVASETLPAKARVARLWGYRTLAVVRGQKGLAAVRALGIEVLEVDREPRLALPQLIEALGLALDEPATLRLLLLLDRATMSALPWLDLAALGRLLDRLLRDRRPLVRAVACNLAARAALHAGDSDRAEALSVTAARALQEVEVLPWGPLGDYLDARWHAHTAIVAIDNGRWQRQGAVWEQLQRRIAVAEAPAPRPVQAIFGRLCLLDAAARWIEYEGRWHGRAAALRESWELRTRERRYWAACLDYARAVNDATATRERWQNACIDVLVSWHDLHGRLPAPGELGAPDWTELALWVEEDGWQWDGFLRERRRYDLIYALRWIAIRHPADRGRWRGLEQAADRILDAVEDEPRYPSFLVPETLLRWRLVEGRTARRAAAILARSELFPAEPTPRHSILCLLARRAAAILDAWGEPHRAPLSAPAGTPLAVLQDELDRDRAHCIRRCPY
ncbi:MAG: hypothetical protein RMM29_09605 [Planctomycetota bacterium]|nr:hypothetical protein [Planctomycetota bacterium]MDW8373885.1 hypothetical protein [Planctomycetota bacterium]